MPVTATIPRTGPGAGPETVAGLLAEHGAVIVEDLLPASVVEAVRADVAAAVDGADPAMRHHNDMLTAFHGDRTRHVSGLAGISRTFATQVMVHPLYEALCDRFLGPNCSRWQLNLAHLLARGPGAEDQLLHRDEDVWMELPYPHPEEVQIASVIAFVDFTKENGATRVVPGSHLHPERQQHVTTRAYRTGDDAAVYAEMPAGSAVIYLGGTVHGASANTTDDAWRWGVHLSYTLGWLRTEENNYLAVPPEVARTLPTRCQEVLGYPICGFLGTLHMGDPMDMLAAGG